MKIDLQESLFENLRNGINLFVGSGFSTYSTNSEGRNLPIGSSLATELIKEFHCPPLNDLSKICTIIDSYNSDGLKNYLVNRFTVSQYDEVYKNILKINAPRIFTTNIDNLIERIYETTNEKYINNVFINGSCYNDSKCIDYIPIHGCISQSNVLPIVRTKMLGF
jgi:hypothetical protein